MIFRYQHAQIAILLTVGKFGMPFYEGNLTLTCLECDTIGRQKSQSDGVLFKDALSQMLATT